MVIGAALFATGLLIGHFWGRSGVVHDFAHMLDFANVQTLIYIGDQVNIKREPLEPDAHYRARLKRGLGR